MKLTNDSNASLTPQLKPLNPSTHPTAPSTELKQSERIRKIELFYNLFKSW